MYEETDVIIGSQNIQLHTIKKISIASSTMIDTQEAMQPIYIDPFVEDCDFEWLGLQMNQKTT